MMRKSPGVHTVRKHRREGHTVRSYKRGKGGLRKRNSSRAHTERERLFIDSLSTTNRQFIHGDFDKDGVTNIDDQKPFDKKNRKQVMEVKLSDELRKLEAHSVRFADSTKRVAEDLERSGHPVKYRIKNVNSIINKLRRRHIEKIEDIGGCMVLVEDKKEAREVGRYIEEKYNVIDKDDYYAKPKAGYEAIHYTIIVEELPVEIQIKTDKDYKKHLDWHRAYKEGTFKVS